MRELLCLVALLLPIGSRAMEPRQVVAEVAATIEREYFDPARAADIALGLRGDAARGDFDRLRNPADLATRLTTVLKPLDGHFNVAWAPETGTRDAPRAVRTVPVPRPERDNFGIRQVQVLPGNVGHLDLRYFADFDFDAAQAPARQAIDAALQLLAHTDALVIDLRDNGGGSPAMVGYLASAFVEPGRDIYNTFHSRGGTASEAPARPHGTPRTRVPLYVLVSGRTASAAEAFAYTLANVQRATLVGEATAGGANPGRPFQLAGGFSVFVSTGSPVSPVTGRNWEGTGVLPDIEVASDEAFDTAMTLALSTLVENGAGDSARWPLEALAAPDTVLSPEALAARAGDYGAVSIEPTPDALRLRHGRRPPALLRPLAPDLFHVIGEPTRRVRFERDAKDQVMALEILTAGGRVVRHARGSDAAR